MTDKIIFLKKKDLKQSYTVKLYPYLQKKISDFNNKLDNILFKNFDSEQINDALYGKFRGKFKGFNHSLSFEFMIALFEELDTDTYREGFIVPMLKIFLEEKKAIEIIDEE